MANVKYVSTREDLKSALALRSQYVVITDRKLAKSVDEVITASDAVLTAAIVAAGIAVTMWWNPVGWGMGLVAATTGATITTAVAFLIVTLGVGVLWALKNEWKIIARGKVTLPDGTTVEGELTLSPK